jgi:3-oxoacid CoA-transferase subunit B
MVITDLAVFARRDRNATFQLVETALDVTVEDVAARTAASFLSLPSTR